MSIADIKYKELIKDIYENGSWDSDKEVRAKYADGTPAYCKSVFGRQIVFEEDELPLLTCKKVFTKTAIKEMILFWIKQSVKKEDFLEDSVKIWDEWMILNGMYKDTLGKSYAYQFETEVNKIVTVDQKLIDLKNKPKHEFALGCLTNNKQDQSDKFFRLWKAMINRCHNVKKDTYKYYGQLGIFVHKDWLDFQTFLKDIKKLPQYRVALRENFIGWELDKDYFKSNCYSKDTCVWLRSSDNKKYMKSVKPIKIIFNNDSEFLFLTIPDVKYKIGSSTSAIHRWLHGSKIPKKYQIKSIEYINDGKIYRNALSKNQVVELINNIKNNPTSKRLLTSFWNYEDVEDKALQECAFQTQWNIRGDKLDLILTQRSGDLGLGVPFNWFQYKVLQLFIAHCTGYKAGRFIHHVGNLHYYDRHESVLLSQLGLQEFEQPTIELKLTNQDYFDITADDIEVKNYICGPYLSMEVAI